MKQYKIIRLKKIKIQEDYEKHPPTMEKMFKKLLYYTMFKKFWSEIVIRYDGTLVDGYTTYILATILGKKFIRVRYKDEIKKGSNK